MSKCYYQIKLVDTRHLPSEREDISVPQIPKESNRGSNEGPEPVSVAPPPHQEPQTLKFRNQHSYQVLDHQVDYNQNHE